MHMIIVDCEDQTKAQTHMHTWIIKKWNAPCRNRLRIFFKENKVEEKKKGIDRDIER